MTTLGFIFRNLYRKRLRAQLTFLSLVVAFLLYVVLGSVAILFTVDAIDGACVNRLVTQAKYSMIESIPKRYLQEIKSVEGVENVASAVWFGGFYQDERNSFPTYPVDPVSYFDIFKELTIEPEVLEKFANTRRGAVAPVALVQELGWKIGDIVLLTSSIYPKKDGSMNWDFELVGTFTADSDSSGSAFLMQYDYFEEENGYGPGTIDWITIRISDPEQGAATSKTIDAMYKNSPDPTRTETETEYIKAFLKQLGNIELMMTGILSAVFFTILLLTGNTMSQSFRERIPELAVLKTFGFTDFSLPLFVMSEAVLLCVIPAILGMLLAIGIVQFGLLQTLSDGFLPNVGADVLKTTFVSGCGIALILGLVIGSVPAITTKRLSIVDALARH